MSSRKDAASPPGDEFPKQLAAAKQASTAQLLMRCARLVNERGIARAAEKFGLPLRATHTTLFPHIDLAGTRQTELARRLGVSKQAVNQLVNELVELGVLERRPDPGDGRAALVCFTARGMKSLLDGLAVLREIEDDMREAIGGSSMEALHQALVGLDRWLSRDPTASS